MNESAGRETHGLYILLPGPNWLERTGAPLLALLTGLGLRLLWAAFTNFTQEDAFITFRFARQIARGSGFVYNPGEHVYGTTSPLFTLALAAWLKLTGSEVVPGARGIDIIAALAAMVFVWLSLRRLRLPPWEAVFVLGTLAFSSQLWLFDTQGMETPLVLLCLSASWWMFTQDRPIWAGALGGLMLWTRIDTGLWLVCMIAIAWLERRFRDGLEIAGSAGLIYLPWLIFAWAYFGSPIPHTVIAKWVAYVSNDHLPLGEHALIIYRVLKPFSIDSRLDPTGPFLSFATLAIAGWYGIAQRRKRAILLLLAFAVADSLRLILTRATAFSHYAVPALWATLVLLGAGLGRMWNQRRSFRPWVRTAYPVAVLLILAVGLGQGVRAALRVQDNQVFRHELGLRAIGEWLDKNAPTDAKIMVEPLGYIGYYSDRYMYDEVGLVTPRIVELKRQGLAAPDYIEALRPDFYVMHCDDALRWLAGNERNTDFFVSHYARRIAFNPVAFDPQQDYEDPSYAAFARNACYEVWEKTR